MSDDSSPRGRASRETNDDTTDFEPDRRSVLRGALATATAAGTPLAGGFSAATGSAAAQSEAQAVIDEYSRPERVAESAEVNEDLFAALSERGFDDDTLTEGIRVSAYDVDGDLLPEQRLYVATPLGVLTAVVSPDGVPFGPYADVVTSPEMMERAGFEWPEEVSELPDGRLAFRHDPEGWVEPGFDGAERIDDVPVVERMCGSGSSDPRQWECTGPSATNKCAYVTCCGHVEILDPSECPNSGGGDTERFDWCEALADRCGEVCWQTGDGDCKCVRIPHFEC